MNDEMKVVLFIDRRNNEDPRITEAMQILDDFGSKHFKNFARCENLKYQINDLGIVWSIPNKNKKNTRHRKKIHDLQRTNRSPLLVVEVGFLKRHIYYSIGWNSTVGFGYYCNQNMPSDRFEKLNLTVIPYQARSDPNNYILICGQVYQDTQLQHINYKKWLISLIDKIRKHTSRKIVFRPHPNQITKKDKWVPLHGTEYSNPKDKSLEDDFKNAHVVLSLNSNCLVEALLAGIPFFAFDSGSVVYEIANHDLNQIENPSFPDEKIKMQTLYNIAYAQWSPEEIQSGEFWEHIKKGMKKSLDSGIDFHYYRLIPVLKKL